MGKLLDFVYDKLFFIEKGYDLVFFYLVYYNFNEIRIDER